MTGSNSSEAYAELERRFRRIRLVAEALGVLRWDSSTCMPPGGAEARAEQQAALARIGHELMAAPDMADLLDAAEAGKAALDPWPAANLWQMRRRWARATALPADLVEAASRANAASEVHWRAARHANDFAGQRPLLEEVLALARESAAARAQALGIEPYDAMLDGYEAGLTRARVDAVFAELEAFLPAFLGEVLERQAAAGPALPLEGPFPRASQRALGLEMMQVLGFDFRHGRLDESHHPFTGGHPEDVRITTRYDEADFMSSLLAVLHETGHALYTRNLPADWRRQPVGDAMGMAVHESQSLIVEMQACRSDAFLGWLAPRAQAAFGGNGPAWTAANLARHVRHVGRDLIRVDASEVTYPLHVILRYRLEQALLSGELAVADLPGAWDEAMEQALGIRPPDLRDGCMQDTHWFGGAFGYFPTYTLGAVAAAQLFQAADRDGEVTRAVAEGDFGPLIDWLRARVHGRGHLHADHDALLTEATGRPLDVQPFLNHLRARYAA